MLTRWQKTGLAAAAGGCLTAGLALLFGRARPAGARGPSPRGGALPLVRSIAGEQGLGPMFVAAMERLAKNESDATLALPARGYAPSQGWGVFQYNLTAWRRLTGDPEALTWLATADEEVRLPIEIDYAPVWRRTIALTGSAYYAERAVRLWHMAPAFVGKFFDHLRAGLTPAQAWAEVPALYVTPSGRTVELRAKIDRKLAGVRYAADSFTAA